MLQTTSQPIIHRLRETDSTNNEAARYYRSATDGEVWVAEFQRAGRGQQANSWESESGKNLLFSIFLRPRELKASGQFKLSQAISLAVCEALQEEGIEAIIKWPNDIYVGKKKIAGMLVEQHIMGADVTSAIVGIGLNVNQLLFCSSAPNPTSMALETGRTFVLDALLHKVLKHIYRRYENLSPANLKDDYVRRLLYYEVWRKYQAAGVYFNGKIIDVLSTGELVVEMEDGQKKSFIFKSITFF